MVAGTGQQPYNVPLSIVDSAYRGPTQVADMDCILHINPFHWEFSGDAVDFA